jgi:hypothetical protein
VGKKEWYKEQEAHELGEEGYLQTSGSDVESDEQSSDLFATTGAEDSMLIASLSRPRPPLWQYALLAVAAALFLVAILLLLLLS